MLKAVKVYLETMGCQMNALDSELVGSLLRQSGMELTADPKAADVLLYNTCSVRQHAEEKVHSRLGWACQRKADGKAIVIGVLGCMAQRLGKDLLSRYAGVDLVCGPGQLARLPELLATARDQKQLAVDEVSRASRPRAGKMPATHRSAAVRQGEQEDDIAAGPALDRLYDGRDVLSTHLPGQAYVRIMHGCDHFCSFCIVPFVRGRQESRSPQSIYQECRRLADAGVTQVTLLGQTVNSYSHRPEGGSETRLADLLERLSDIAGLRRLRFVTGYPTDFDDRLLQAMRDLPKVCEFLHVPAQSGSDRMLRAMNRHYTRDEYDQLIDRARSIVPGICIAGDFIVGFPGESEEDHQASADLIRRTRYRNSYIFKYSPRPGTLSAKRLGDDVPEAQKKRRNGELLAVQAQVSLAGNAALIGSNLEVLVEGVSRRSGKQPKGPAAGQVQLIGRSRGDHIVVFDGPKDLAGQYVNVRIESATALTLAGKREA
jgi:tRNA-2-methylthio-N6-dimethylallyladenosine synthase